MSQLSIQPNPQSVDTPLSADADLTRKPEHYHGYIIVQQTHKYLPYWVFESCLQAKYFRGRFQHIEEARAFCDSGGAQ